MSDNFENKNEQTPEATPVESTPANEPVNGAYHYRTYDLKARQGEEEPQATFGSADWQWQPAQPVEEAPPKKRRKIKWGKVILSTVELAPKDKLEIGKGTFLFVPLCGDDFAW